ncbi:MAG TPA: hypothetical protein VJV22_19505, partial [Acidobacteriaceae bacterium]|nr:hypothetical protein [Acidobacteriaceae bacterium]
MATATEQTTWVQSWLDAYTEAGKNAPGPAWLKQLREEAFSRFCDQGFPTTRDEDWRFTNVAAVARTA